MSVWIGTFGPHTEECRRKAPPGPAEKLSRMPHTRPCASTTSPPQVAGSTEYR